MLLIFEYEIVYTRSGGFTPLHQVLDPQQAQFVRDMYSVPLPHEDPEGLKAPVLSLHEASAFNRFLEQHETMNLKCQSRDLDYYQQSNNMHEQMRLCKQNLEQAIGWEVPSGGVLQLTPSRGTLLSGFYLSYMQRPAEKTFLETLLDTPWHLAQYTSPETAICQATDDAVRVMAPFWGEYFDVAASPGAQEPSLACDFERSSDTSIIMVYDTLCAGSGFEASGPCAEHPRYRRHLQETLPEECEREQGKVVVRQHLGALKAGATPLCDLQPSFPSSCQLKHGALNGWLGIAVRDLADTHPVAATQVCFWNSSNSIFRGLEQLGLDDVRTLAISVDDIAGHCLEFIIDARGVLSLRSAFLASQCDPTSTGGRVRSWLADIEEEWAWDHALSSTLSTPPAVPLDTPAEEQSPAWTCPLYWLQQYHDDNTKFQARSPSWQRNAARFEHLTLEYKYAHPTVRHANKIRRVRAARFLSDALGCVAPAEQCHGKEHLAATIEHLLQPEQWRKVEYVPREHPECARVLDWPADCGRVHADGFQDGQPAGECLLRQ